jgi:hypothetical protein
MPRIVSAYSPAPVTTSRNTTRRAQLALVRREPPPVAVVGDWRVVGLQAGEIQWARRGLAAYRPQDGGSTAARAKTGRREYCALSYSRGGVPVGDDNAYWSWRDEVMAHPDGRAKGGEPCVQCSKPVPPNTHWKHRDRHVCSPRCNLNLGRKFSRMMDGAQPRDGSILPEQPAARPNPRTRPVPTHFGMLDEPFPYDFDGYGPVPGDTVTRHGSETTYSLAAMDVLGPPLAAYGLGNLLGGPILVAYHPVTATAQLVAADSVDLTAGRLHLAMLSGFADADSALVVGPPAHWETVLPGLDGRTYRWVTEDIRDALPDDTAINWHAVVCLPAEAPFTDPLWSPAYQERSKRLRRISATVAAHARRVRVESGAVERFAAVEVYERDSWMCGICGDPIDPALKWPEPRSASLDHVLPLAANGEHTRANTQAAHLLCNIRKGARTS